MLSRRASSTCEELTRFDLEVVLSLRWSSALAATLAAACITVAPAHSGVSCGPSGYAYAGIQPGQSAYGVSVRLASLAAPVVESGHVAGWVGVGGPGQGPGGSNEWIQVGLNSLPGATNKLYYEVMRPGLGQTYAEVATDVPNGRSLRLAVLETAATPGAWRVWVNGVPVTPAIRLAGSHGALSPMAMGESWDGGRPSCNRYAYRFDKVSLAAAPGGPWLPVRNAAVLQDSGYKVVKRAVASFDAGAVAALATAPAITNPLAVPKAPTAKPAKPAAPTPVVAASAADVLAAPAVSADAPLRKGFLPSPTIEAILGVTAQPNPTVVTAEPAVAVTPTPAQPSEPASSLGLGGSVAVTEAQVQ